MPIRIKRNHNDIWENGIILHEKLVNILMYETNCRIILEDFLKIIKSYNFIEIDVMGVSVDEINKTIDFHFQIIGNTIHTHIIVINYV
jgi:hypothetical protein